mmetsp:Transcript_19192/g.57048  ORF Transcript_19192/g.57048 Transcript_19192/m.57048 type:complete len:641 (+) Transcript_19192:42-1964(+)
MPRLKSKKGKAPEKITSLSKLTVGGKIGSGSFGSVFSCTIRRDKRHQLYALKELNRKQIDRQRLLKQVEAERDIAFLLKNHPHVVQQYSYWVAPLSIYILMEHADGGDMFDMVTARIKRKEMLSDGQVSKYIAQMGSGLDFIHGHDVAYRDLKLENILYRKSNDTCVLADFGLSKRVPSGATTTTICGTIQYMAPELLNDEPYTARIDWWSLGVVAFLMLTGKYPYSRGKGKLKLDCSADDRYLMYARISAGLIDFPDSMSDGARVALGALMEKDPAQRVTSTATLLQLQWIATRGGSQDPASEAMPAAAAVADEPAPPARPRTSKTRFSKFFSRRKEPKSGGRSPSRKGKGKGWAEPPPPASTPLSSPRRYHGGPPVAAAATDDGHSAVPSGASAGSPGSLGSLGKHDVPPSPTRAFATPVSPATPSGETPLPDLPLEFDFGMLPPEPLASDRWTARADSPLPELPEDSDDEAMPPVPPPIDDGGGGAAARGFSVGSFGEENDALGTASVSSSPTETSAFAYPVAASGSGSPVMETWTWADSPPRRGGTVPAPRSEPPPARESRMNTARHSLSDAQLREILSRPVFSGEPSSRRPSRRNIPEMLGSSDPHGGGGAEGGAEGGKGQVPLSGHTVTVASTA